MSTRARCGGVTRLRSLVVVLLLTSCVGQEPAAPPDSAPAPPDSAPAPLDSGPVSTDDDRVRHLSVSGDDDGPGSRDRPWRTFTHAFSSLEAGQKLVVEDGTYTEQVREPPLRPGRPEAPIDVVAAEGAAPVLSGLLWLRDADHWSLRGINVTWDDERNEDDEHMVKLSGGTGWSLSGAEIFGARSFAAVLVADGPADWTLRDLCVHGTEETNGTNQDHLVYVNTGEDAGPGVIEDSLLFDAPNGSGVKVGGPSSDSEGSVDVAIRRNTIVEAAQPILLAWATERTTIEDNLIGAAGPRYGAIRGYRLDGAGNVARGNVAFDVATTLLNDDGHRGVIDGSGNEVVTDPGFDRTGTCDGYRPADPTAAAVGHGSSG